MNTPKTLLLMASLLFGLSFWSQKSGPKIVSKDDVLEDVAIQPAKALEIAEPYLEEHATEHWNKDKPLLTYIVWKGKYYYISRTNYPAKTINYYLQPAVKVHTRTGEVSFVTSSNKKTK